MLLENFDVNIAFAERRCCADIGEASTLVKRQWDSGLSSVEDLLVLDIVRASVLWLIANERNILKDFYRGIRKRLMPKTLQK